MTKIFKVVFRRRILKYSDLNPGDRIRKLIEEYVEPEMTELGFKLLKSELTFKRKINDFTQEIHVAKHQKNHGKSHVKFWLILSVSSKLYVNWHHETFGVKPLNEIVSSWYDNQIDSWSFRYKKGGHYDLAKFDNEKLMFELTKNIKEFGIPLLNKVSNWENAAEYLMDKEQYGDISKVFDFYLLAGNIKKAQESISLVEEQFKQLENVPEGRFEEITLRKNLLRTLS